MTIPKHGDTAILRDGRPLQVSIPDFLVDGFLSLLDDDGLPIAVVKISELASLGITIKQRVMPTKAGTLLVSAKPPAPGSLECRTAYRYDENSEIGWLTNDPHDSWKLTDEVRDWLGPAWQDRT